jgi:hypothetical protein
MLMKKSKLKILLAFMKSITNLENPFSNQLQWRCPTAAILTLKMHTGSQLWSCKIVPPETSKFWGIFTAANKGSMLENIDQSHLREANTNFLYVKHDEKLKTWEAISSFPENID